MVVSMNQGEGQTIELQTEKNPWLFRCTVALSLCGAFLKLQSSLAKGDALGATFLLVIFLGIAIAWLAQPRKVLVSFDSKKAIFVYSSLNPFRKRKEVSLDVFSRVYEQPCGYGGRSIHFSGPRGEHLLLVKLHPRLWNLGIHAEEAKSLRHKLAAGLKIANGGAM